MNYFKATIVMAIATSAASAGVVDMKFTGKGAGSNVQIQLGERDTQNVFAGQLEHTIANAAGDDAFLNGTHYTFCADIIEHVTSDFDQYQLTDIENIPLTRQSRDPMSSVRADAIRSLFAFNQSTLLAGGISNDFGTAMQITVWEIINDFDGTADSINLDAGNLTIAGKNGDDLNTNIINHFNGFKIQMLNAMNQGQSDINYVLGLANEGHQDQLVVVPAPGAMALLTIGGLMTSRRRR